MQEGKKVLKVYFSRTTESIKRKLGLNITLIVLDRMFGCFFLCCLLEIQDFLPL